jgi:soluble lytic murein transglycosylase-like protein
MNIGLLTSIARKGVVAFAAVTGCICAHAEMAATPERLAGLRAEALSFEHGEGVPRNPDLAIQRYCEAARLGDAESQYRLGWIYANGRGVARDDGVASYFFSLAARQGNSDAERMLKYVAVGAVVQPPKCMVDDREAETIVFENPTPAQQKVLALIGKLAPEYGVSPRLALAVIRAESNFDPTAVSSKNAQGLMQLIPETAVRFNVRKPFDPEQNIRGGLSYLRWLLAYYKGDVTLVAAAYNAGEGAVNRFAGVPPFAETRGYVQRIRELFRRDQHPYDPSVVDPSPDLPRIRARMM